MKLTITVTPFHINDKHIEIRTYFDDGMKELGIQEVLLKDLCKNKRLVKRIVDRLFYELKDKVYKHFALID